MNVLIACEESQRVCMAFRELGHTAFSCDILECSGGHPEWHIKGDCLPLLKAEHITFTTEDGVFHIVPSWDLLIAHPPCTFLTCTGNRWFNIEKYGDAARQRYKLREEAAEFFMQFANAPIERICIENPIGYMNTHYRKPNQIISPFMFGNPFEKKTCLWLKNLPNLEATDIVKPEERTVYKSGKSMPKWYADLASLPPAERSRERSKTFPGIAKAMAEQWGGDV